MNCKRLLMSFLMLQAMLLVFSPAAVPQAVDNPAAAPAAAPAPKPAAPAPAAPGAPAAAAPAPSPTAAEKAEPPVPKPVPPEQMDAKALLYPKTVVRQEIEIGKSVVTAVISQLLAGMAKSGSPSDQGETKQVQDMLSSEAVRTALSGAFRLLVVAMVPASAEAAAATPGAADVPVKPTYSEGDKVAAYYGDLFAQYDWTSAIRTVEPQLRKSFGLLLAPESKGLFFVVADAYGITTVLILSDSSLTPLLDVLAPILGRGIFPTGLPTPSTSGEAGPRQ